MSVSELTLKPFAGPTGAVCMLAIDHRDALRNAFQRAGAASVTADEMIDFKCRILTALGARPSGVLLDPATLQRYRPRGGLLLPLEDQGHESIEGGRINHLLANFGPDQAATLAVQGCKLLLYYRADHAPTAERQRALAVLAAKASHAAGLAFTLEPLVYPLEGEDEETYRACFADLVIAGARELTETGADILKVQFPTGDDEADACGRLNEAVSPMAWALLGGSEVDGDTFARQLDVACSAGASGFIAGRAIWAGALGLAGEEQSRWLREHAAIEFERLTAIACQHQSAESTKEELG